MAHKVTITAAPRQGYRGFGAIERYFISEQPVHLVVSDVEFKELNSDPAKFFVKVENADEDVTAEVTAAALAEVESAK